MTGDPEVDAAPVPEKVKHGVLRRDGNQCRLRRALHCRRIAMDVHRTQPHAEVGDDPRHIVAACAVCLPLAGPGHGVEITLVGGPEHGRAMVLVDEPDPASPREAFTVPHLGGLPGSPKYAHVLHYVRRGEANDEGTWTYSFLRAD